MFDRKHLYELVAAAVIALTGTVVGVVAKSVVDPSRPIHITKPMPIAADGPDYPEPPLLRVQGDGEFVLDNGAAL